MATLATGVPPSGMAEIKVRVPWRHLDSRSIVVPGVYLLRQDRGAL